MKRAFYDFAVSPYSYDFVSFMVAAKGHGCDEIVFVPGRRMIRREDGTVEEFQKCSVEEQAFRMKNLILPLASKYRVCKDRAEAKHYWHPGCFPDGYTVDRPKAAHMLRDVMTCGKLYPLGADPAKIAQAKIFGMDESTIVITIRESFIKTERNSNTEQWVMAADWLVENGHKVVFIPDTDNRFTTFGKHKSIPEASVDVQLRLAIYHLAKLNMGVNNGPMALALYSRRPLLYFRPLGYTTETSGEFWVLNMVPPGAQPPWFKDSQRIIWEGGDEADNIIRNFRKWSAVRSGEDQWKESLAPTFPVRGVMNPEERHENMKNALQKGAEYGFKWHPKASHDFHEGTLSIVCFGPSLKHTWQNVKRPFMTVSGAHDFMASRGMVPDYHTDCDPREYKCEHTKNPIKGVKYLMATCCHPKMWEQLKDQDVYLWHLHNGAETDEWLKVNDPGKDRVGGGTTAGSRAFELGARLGFRKFEVYGMDCSFEGEETHAGSHNGKKQRRIRVRCAEREFDTSPQMVESAREMQKMFSIYDVDVTLHGDGLLAKMLSEGKRMKEQEAA